MNVDFFHSQIIRDTITPKFIESFNENLLPSLCLKYGESLDCVQFYEHHITDGLRISGVFYYPLTVVVSGVAKTEWISWPVANYRHYENFNPFTYKGQDFLDFNIVDEPSREITSKIEGKPIYSPGNTLPIILSAASDDKTFLAGKYSQSFIDLLAACVTEAIEAELAISGLSGSGVILEMNFMPGTFMEHKVKNVTYRRLRIKARACAARDLWVKWTRLDGEGTFTISDNPDRSQIRFDLAEDVPGNIKEREYRYLTAESLEKYQASMGRKNITEWREMMRRVIRRGEVEKNERIRIVKPVYEEEPSERSADIPAYVNAVTIPSAAERERDELTERLNALLGKTSEPAAPEIKSDDEDKESINSDINELLRGALGASAPTVPSAVEEPAEEALEESAEPSCEAEETELSDTKDSTVIDTPAEEKPMVISASPVKNQNSDSELEARIRRELEEKMRAEMDELRKKNEENEALRARLEAQNRAEQRERERLAEAARLAVLDKEKREADRRAEEERERLEAEKRAAEEKRLDEERKREAEAKAERERIEAQLAAAKGREAEMPRVQSKYISKTVTLIFRRGGVDSAVTKRVREIILATIKYLHKEDVYIRIKATIADTNTLVLAFSEVPESEQQLIIDIIQVIGKSNMGVTKAILE